MAYLNEVRLIGNLTRDPEARSTPAGTSITKFGIAVTRQYKGRDGVRKEETAFIEVTTWEGLANNCAQYLKKGSCVFLAGRIKFDSWEDKQTGQKRSKLSVVADSVQFLDKKPQGNKQQDTRLDWDVPQSDRTPSDDGLPF